MTHTAAQPAVDANNQAPVSRAGHFDAPTTRFFGLQFASFTINGTLDCIDAIIQKRVPRQLNFVNAYTLSLCQANPHFMDVLTHSDLNLADGMSVVWAAKRLKLNIPERVAGPDLAEALCQRAEKRGYRLFFMGSSQENLDMLKKALLGRYPALNIVGMLSPSMCDRFSDEENQKIIAEVRHAAPDILFVGISTQKQEIWMSENLQKLNVPASLGVGAAFDFLSGRVPRAPEWLQKNGLEWMYRLFCEPKRLWKRYLLGNALFLYLLIKESLRRRLA